LPDFLTAILRVFLFLFHFSFVRPKEAEKMENSIEDRTTQEPEFLTPEQLSIKLQLARKTIKKWTLARRIPGQIKCGGRWRYSRLAIEKAILRGELLNP
jgi:hypothetical protein